jgi:uncharacterized DUF497 family protein
MRFVWDAAKRRANLAKHGLDFHDAPEIFDGPMLVALDNRRDYGEDRITGIGWIKNRVVVIVYSEPEADTVRVISLRKANKHERERFEKELAERLGTS